MRVMLATDGNDTSRNAANFALMLTEKTGSTLFIVLIVPSAKDKNASQNIRQGKKVLLELKNIGLDHKIDTKVFMEIGDPLDKIQELIGFIRPDMLIIGGSQRNRLNKMMLGSVEDYLVKNCPVPLTIVR